MKIWIIDDHPLVGTALESLLLKEFEKVSISIGTNWEEIQNNEPQSSPDLAVVDLNLHGKMGGYETLRNLQKAKLRTKVVVLSMHAEKIYIEKAFRLGADAYVVKSDPPKEIVNAIKSVALGKKYSSPSALIVQTISHAHSLSDRENQIARLVCDGLSSKKISQQLKISQRTVETHRQNIMKKLNVSNVVQLIKTLEKGLD